MQTATYQRTPRGEIESLLRSDGLSTPGRKSDLGRAGRAGSAPRCAPAGTSMRADDCSSWLAARSLDRATCARCRLRHRRAWRLKLAEARCPSHRGRSLAHADQTGAVERAPSQPCASEAVEFRAGDMLDSATLGQFDYVVAMDSLIHYRAHDADAGPDDQRSCGTNGPNTGCIFTVAPRTAALDRDAHRSGRVFPRGNRAPAIVPVARAPAGSGLIERSAAPVGTGRSCVKASG